MEHLNETKQNEKFTAIVGGATGATGRWIVTGLINGDDCVRVVALTRSDIASPADTFPEADKDKMAKKLVVKKVDFKSIVTSGELPSDLGEKPSIGFCAMGSAPYTEESDFTVPVAFGRACKAAGVDSMFLVSAVNSKSGSCFGYVDTLGRREDAYKGMDFKRLGIYQPGFLGRQEKMRFKEMFQYIVPSSWTIDTKDLAKVMIESANRLKDGHFTFTHKEMKTIASGLH